MAGRKALHLDNLILTRQRHLLKGSCCEMVSPLENTAQWRRGRRIASNAIRVSFVRWRFLNVRAWTAGRVRSARGAGRRNFGGWETEQGVVAVVSCRDVGIWCLGAGRRPWEHWRACRSVEIRLWGGRGRHILCRGEEMRSEKCEGEQDETRRGAMGPRGQHRHERDAGRFAVQGGWRWAEKSGKKRLVGAV